MRLFLHTLLILSGLLVAVPANGQVSTGQTTRISVAEGLNSHLVTDVIQDDQGFLWIATIYGLNRYDGNRIKQFPELAENGEPYGRAVYEILHYLPGQFLLGTDRGLETFDRSDFSFHPVLAPPTQGIPEAVQSVSRDSLGFFWACTPRHIHRLGPSLNLLASFATQPFPRGSRNRNVLRQLCLPSGENLFWMHDGLRLWDPVGNSLGEVDGRHARYGFLAGTPPYRVALLDGRYLMRLDSARATLLDLGDGSWHELPVPGPSSMAFCGSWSGHFALGTTHEGLNLYALDRSQGRLEVRPIAAGVLPGISVSNLFRDDEGNVWAVTTQQGLIKVDGGGIRFNHAPLSGARPGEAGPHVGQVARLGDRILVATFGSGFDEFAPDGTYRRNYSVELSRDSENMVWAFQQVGRQVWIGTQQGVVCQDMHTMALTRLRMPHPGLLDSVPITTLFKDSQDHIWMGLGRGNGLGMYNAATGTFHLFPFGTGGYPFRYPLQAGEDARGDLWFTNDATSDLVRWDRSTARFHVVSVPGTHSTLQYPSGGFLLDPLNDELWYGLFPLGLVRYDLRTGKSTILTTSQGLSAPVMGITMDRHQRLWLSTSQGISCLVPATGEVVGYTRSDGLAVAFHSAIPFHDRTSNRLYTGGSGWLTWFEVPDTLVDNRPLRVVPTGFSVNEKPWPLRQNSSYTLGPDENNLLVQFAAISLAGGAANRYQYRLNGGAWSDLGSTPEIRFGPMRHGHYALEVRAARKHGPWGDAVHLLQFTVRPRFTSTPWFFLLWAAGISALAFTWYRYRMSHLNKLANMRAAISQDLHDEIGSRLTNINLMGQLVRQNPVRAESEGLLAKIQEESQAISQSMREIIWSVDPGHDHLALAFPRLLTFASQLLEAAGMQVRAEVDNLDHVRLDMAERRDLFLIFKEAVHNVAKHSGATMATIRARVDKQAIHLEVEDNGKGFAHGCPPNTGGIRNMHERAARHGWQMQVNGARGHGCRTALRIPFR